MREQPPGPFFLDPGCWNLSAYIETICIGPRFLRELVILRTPDSAKGLLGGGNGENRGACDRQRPEFKRTMDPTLVCLIVGFALGFGVGRLFLSIAVPRYVNGSTDTEHKKWGHRTGNGSP